MTDPNSDLVAQLAHRPNYEKVTAPVPVVEAEWNAPIDTIQADCLSLRNLIRGWVGDAKDNVWRWVPAPMPEDWYG